MSEHLGNAWLAAHLTGFTDDRGDTQHPPRRRIEHQRRRLRRPGREGDIDEVGGWRDLDDIAGIAAGAVGIRPCHLPLCEREMQRARVIEAKIERASIERT